MGNKQKSRRTAKRFYINKQKHLIEVVKFELLWNHRSMPHHLERKLEARHSFYSTQAPIHSSQIEKCSKSDANITNHEDFSDATITIQRHENSVFDESYKEYGLDEIPVKDSNYNDYKERGDKKSITNSELDKLEKKIYNNVSQDLQEDKKSLSSLDSNIKFFRTTVQEIFDNFYASMQDFELYKKRFHDILAKNREDALSDMEEFIKDMIQHIMSSESSLSYDSKNSNEQTFFEVQDKQTNVSNVTDESSIERNTSSETTTTGDKPLDSVLQTYKNDNYLTDSTVDENLSKAKRARKEEIFNIFLLSGNPCVHIKMNDRNLLSEINIKDPNSYTGTESNHVASADNLKILAAKMIELEKYTEDHQNNNAPDIEIPVKVSNAKKNIHMNEEFDHEREAQKSLISKICSFLCKKMRKAPFN